MAGNDEPNEPRPSTGVQAKYGCIVCEKRFAYNSNMVRHVKTMHGEEGLKLIPPRPSFSCEQCNAVFSYSENLLQHRKTAHGFKENTVNLEFATADGFLLWKDSEERRAKVHFISRRGPRQCKEGLVKTFQCHRSGRFVSQGEGKRRLKTKGSCKTGIDCPARMRSTARQDGSVLVEYQKEHCSHTKDISHQRLSKTERDVLLGQLMLGVPPSAIISNVRPAGSERQSRLDIATKQDLRNLCSKFKINVENHLDEEKSKTSKSIEVPLSHDSTSCSPTRGGDDSLSIGEEANPPVGSPKDSINCSMVAERLTAQSEISLKVRALQGTWAKKQTSTSDPESRAIMRSALQKLEEAELLLASLPDSTPLLSGHLTSCKRKMETPSRFFPAHKRNKHPDPASVPGYIGNTGKASVETFDVHRSLDHQYCK